MVVPWENILGAGILDRARSNGHADSHSEDRGSCGHRLQHIPRYEEDQDMAECGRRS